MQRYDLKNIAFRLNMIFIAIVCIEIVLAFTLESENNSWEAWVMWYAFASSLFLVNYFFLTPRIFKNGFTPIKVLLLFFIYSIMHYSLAMLWSYCVVELYYEVELQQNFTSYVSRFQTTFFYFMLSTSTRVIKMFATNQIKIKDLESEHQINELKALQSGVQTDLISKYIRFLQEKNKTESVSEDIVELADFLRYITYSGELRKASFESELEQLKRFIKVIQKGTNVRVLMSNFIEINPLIPVFGLITSLKEVLLKLPDIQSFELALMKKSEKIELTLSTEEYLSNIPLLKYSKTKKTVRGTSFVSIVNYD